MLRLPVGGLEAEGALGVHDDGTRPGGGLLGVAHVVGWSRALSADGREQTLRNHEHAAEHHRRQRRKLSFELEFAQPLLEAGLQRIRAPRLS